jgi:hypothetical protein
MRKAVRLSSTSPFLAILLLALCGCARDAPALPPVLEPVPAPAIDAQQRDTECAKLTADIATWRSEMDAIEQVIYGRRKSDQATGYMAASLFPPLALTIDQQTAQKKALDERQQKVDQALARQKALRCPSNPVLPQK